MITVKALAHLLVVGHSPLKYILYYLLTCLCLQLSLGHETARVAALINHDLLLHLSLLLLLPLLLIAKAADGSAKVLSSRCLQRVLAAHLLFLISVDGAGLERVLLD